MKKGGGACHAVMVPAIFKFQISNFEIRRWRLQFSRAEGGREAVKNTGGAGQSSDTTSVMTNKSRALGGSQVYNGVS